MSLIVIVDDRTTNRTIYSKLALTIGEGIKVRAFAEPGEALKWLERNRPDLIVTDYEMPQMNGEEFISRFRGLPHSAGVPIMMITVCDQRKLRLRALESGATDFLNTPIDHCEFLMRARNLLKLSHDAEARADGGKSDGAKTAAASPKESDAAKPGLSEGARRVLAQCGEDEAYALHVVAFDESGDADAIAALLYRQLRHGDLLSRIEEGHFVLLQRNVVDPADAQACDRRLSGLGAAALLRVGTALPRAGVGASSERAASCLRDATALALRGAECAPVLLGTDGESVRFLPRINLHSGAVVGAQILYGGRPAEAGDPAALRAALASVASLRHPPRHEARFSLRLGLGGGAVPWALRAAPLLSGARVAPARIDLQVCAREALVDPTRVEAETRAAKTLGMAITLDLAALGLGDLREGDQWAALLGAFIDAWRPVIKFPCGDGCPVVVARLLRAILARRVGCGPLLLADGVPTPDRLTPLREAGVSLAQGACFGEAFRIRDLKALLIGHARAQASKPLARRA